MNDNDDLPELTELLRSEPIDIDPDARARAVQAALAAYEPTPAVDSPQPTARPRPKRNYTAGLAVLGAAAAVAVVMGIGVAALGRSTGSDQVASAGGDAAPMTTTAMAEVPATAPPPGEGGDVADAEAGAVADLIAPSMERGAPGDASELGAFSDAGSLAAVVAAKVLAGELDDGARSPAPCPVTDPSTPAPYVWRATVGPDRVWAIAVVDLRSDVTEVVVSADPGCEELFRRAV